MSDEVTEQQPEPELITLDPEEVAAKLDPAIRGVIDAAGLVVRSAPYGILPDPAHVAVLRDAYKKLEMVYGEMEVTAKLIALASPQDDGPKDIQTEGM